MKDYPYLYRGSLAEARRRNQISLWRESLQENIRCKNAIEEAIRMNFDGMHMRFDCIEPMIRDFGFLRIAWVLSNTLQQKEWDGRFNYYNKEWAKTVDIPPNPDSFGFERNRISKGSSKIRPVWYGAMRNRLLCFTKL